MVRLIDLLLFLLEETKGNLPLWLAPIGVEVIPVSSEHHLEYAKNVYQRLLAEGIKAELDSRNEKLGYRLREAQTRKINYTLILGDNEKLDRTASYRDYMVKRKLLLLVWMSSSNY